MQFKIFRYVDDQLFVLSFGVGYELDGRNYYLCNCSDLSQAVVVLSALETSGDVQGTHIYAERLKNYANLRANTVVYEEFNQIIDVSWKEGFCGFRKNAEKNLFY